MKVRLSRIEDRIEWADRSWRKRVSLRDSALVGAGVALWVLAVGAAAVAGWLTATAQAGAIMTVGLIMGFVAWLVAMLVVWAAPVKRDRLIGAIEASHDGMMDRLNTLDYLEHKAPRSPLIEPIAVQAAHVLARTKPIRPFAIGRIWWQLATCAALVLITWLFYWRYEPWDVLRAAEERERASHLDAAQDEPFAIPPDQQLSESAQDETREWREIRISKPGCDLRAASFEILDIRIEVAASEPLDGVRWWSSLNGAPHEAHDLTSPPDSDYGVFDTELDLAALGVKDWDVVLYYAESSTRNGQRFVSDLYFIEALPLREQLASLPGGIDGRASELLQATSSLIQQQLAAIRDEFQMEQRAAGQSAADPLVDERRRREETANLEKSLADDARRLATRIGDDFGSDSPASTTMERLAAAATELEAAQQGRTQGAPPDQPNAPRADHDDAARAALRELLAARRAAREFIEGHGELFRSDEQQARMARDVEDMRRRADELQAARAAVRETLEAQRAIQRDIDPAKPAEMAELAERQRRLADSFQQRTDAMPHAFREVKGQCDKAGTAMGAAADGLRAGQATAQELADRAGNALRDLDSALELQQSGTQNQNPNQLADGGPPQDGDSSSSPSGANGPGNSPLRETGHGALARGLRELDSLARQDGRSRPMTEQQQAQLRRDAAALFADAVPGIYGHNDRTRAFVDRMRNELTEKMTPVDRETVRQLVSQLDSIRRDMNVAPPRDDRPTDRRHMDASLVPPAYRRAVETYFRSLSEEK